jgi:hypothetical protein
MSSPEALGNGTGVGVDVGGTLAEALAEGATLAEAEALGATDGAIDGDDVGEPWHGSTMRTYEPDVGCV